MEMRERNTISYNNPDPDPAPPSNTTGAATPATIRYLECLKNHAANMGAHVLDGCGEFMPSGEHNTPESLKCAACDCHRSFHRREVAGEYYTQRIPLTHNPPPRVQRPPVTYHRPMLPVMMAFGGTSGAPAESSSEDLNVFRVNAGVQIMAQRSKKRFRTKFTQEQKDKMHEFAERIGWRIQKQDEQEVLRFCNEVGLKRQVFKVWMHNNKQAVKKKEL